MWFIRQASVSPSPRTQIADQELPLNILRSKPDYIQHRESCSILCLRSLGQRQWAELREDGVAETPVVLEQLRVVLQSLIGGEARQGLIDATLVALGV